MRSIMDRAREAEEAREETSLLEDAERILAETPYVLLRAAWDEFLHILRIDSNYDEDEERTDLLGMATPAWYALRKIRRRKGNLTEFTIYELHLLKALKDGYVIYDEILHVLMDHHDDAREGRYLFETHPEIHDAIPEEYDNPKQVLEVLAEIVRMYRWELEEFSRKHSATIDNAINQIVKKN